VAHIHKGVGLAAIDMRVANRWTVGLAVPLEYRRAANLNHHVLLLLLQGDLLQICDCVEGQLLYLALVLVLLHQEVVSNLNTEVLLALLNPYLAQSGTRALVWSADVAGTSEAELRGDLSLSRLAKVNLTADRSISSWKFGRRRLLRWQRPRSPSLLLPCSSGTCHS